MYDLTHYCCKQVSSKKPFSFCKHNYSTKLLFFSCHYQFSYNILQHRICKATSARNYRTTLEKFLIYLVFIPFRKNKFTCVCLKVWNSCNKPSVTKYIFVFLNEDHQTLKMTLAVISYSCHNHRHNIEMRWNHHLPYVIRPSCYEKSDSMHLQLFYRFLQLGLLSY